MKPDLSDDQITEFEAGLKILTEIDSVCFRHIGTPASTSRPVIDRSHAYKLVVGFHDLAGHDRYQVAQDHLDFIARCGKYWHNVRIYDSNEVTPKTR